MVRSGYPPIRTIRIVAREFNDGKKGPALSNFGPAVNCFLLKVF